MRDLPGSLDIDWRHSTDKSTSTNAFDYKRLRKTHSTDSYRIAECLQRSETYRVGIEGSCQRWVPFRCTHPAACVRCLITFIVMAIECSTVHGADDCPTDKDALGAGGMLLRSEPRFPGRDEHSSVRNCRGIRRCRAASEASPAG
jgi:hypothetical protein